MKRSILVIMMISALATMAQAGTEDGSRKVGHFNNPTKEVLDCHATWLPKGTTRTQEGIYASVDVSIPGPFGPNTQSVRTIQLLESNGLKVMFETYGAGITLFVVPTNADSHNDSNWLAESSTSLGPIRDADDEKIYLTYRLPKDGSLLQGYCNYSEYIDQK